MKQQNNRPTWDEYFLEVMHALARRATCDRGRTACVIVKDKQIVVSGYVGSPPGLPHCDEVGHLMKKVVEEDGTISEHCMRTIHAEQNAICQAAKLGNSVDGGHICITCSPCLTCLKLIINAGITRVVFNEWYKKFNEQELNLIKEAGLLVIPPNEEGGL